MHSHSHSGENPKHSSNRIAWAFSLNLCFTVIEFIGGWLTNSTAIMADAVHDLGDSLSIGLAWLLSKLSDKSADSTFTYGYHRFSLFGALVNAFVLISGSVWVLSMAIPRLAQPQMPNAEGMLGLAVLGVLVNGFAAYKLSRGKSLNERVINWHLLEDVLGWCAVLVVSLVLLVFDWPILDPILSIAFTLFILFNVSKYLWLTTRLFLQAVPDKAMRHQLIEQLSEVDRVSEIHRLHLWSLDGERHVLTAHLVLDAAVDLQQQAIIKGEIAERLSGFALEHTTIEFELPDENCRDFESNQSDFESNQ